MIMHELQNRRCLSIFLIGSYEESFEKLFRFLLVIKKSNPRTIVDSTCKENLDDSTMVQCLLH